MEFEMKSQPIAKVSEDDVERIIKRDFTNEKSETIMNIFYEYKSESIQGRNRVLISILKLSDGDINKLRKYVEIAKTDYRDVIAWAEYPNYFENTMKNNKLSQKEIEKLYDLDWQEYQKWFLK
jgi:hypothetical protein